MTHWNPPSHPGFGWKTSWKAWRGNGGILSLEWIANSENNGRNTTSAQRIFESKSMDPNSPWISIYHQDYKGQDQTCNQTKHRKTNVFVGFPMGCWRRARVIGNLLKGVLSNLRTLQKIIENYPSKPIRIPFESSSSNFGGHEPRKPCYTSNHILLVGGFNALEK